MRWIYLSFSGERIGPVTTSELADLKSKGSIDDQTFICAENQNEWLPYSELPEYVDRRSVERVSSELQGDEVLTDSTKTASAPRSRSRWIGAISLCVVGILVSFITLKQVTVQDPDQTDQSLVETIVGEVEEGYFSAPMSELETAQMDAFASAALHALEEIGQISMYWTYSGLLVGKCDEFFTLEEAALSGAKDEMYLLGDLYRKGICVPNDDSLAFEWLERTAKSGYQSAYYDLGIYHLDGIGTKKDPEKAVEWFEKASLTDKQGYVALAQLYFVGKEVVKDFARALGYATKGAELGVARSQLFVAVLLSIDGFDFQDNTESYKWALLAENNDDSGIKQSAKEHRLELEKKLSIAEVQDAQGLASNWKVKTNEELNPTKLAQVENENLPDLSEINLVSLTKIEARRALENLAMARDRYYFFRAISENNLNLTRLFLKAGASVETHSPVGRTTPLMMAVRNGAFEVAKILIDEGADVNRSVNEHNEPALLLAISHGNRRLTKLLLNQNADVTHPGIMYNAVEFDDPSLLQLLVERGAKIDADYGDSLGTPLRNALYVVEDFETDAKRVCKVRSVKFLLDNGANVNLVKGDQHTALTLAISSENSDACVKLLLETGVSATERTPRSRSPLYVTLLNSKVGIARTLLANGADPNERIRLPAEQVPFILGEDGMEVVMNNGTLLHLAVAQKNMSMAKTLYENGGDSSLESDTGASPLSLARKNNLELLVNLFSKR